MEKEEQLFADYQRTRRELEESEDSLKYVECEGEQLIQETLDDIRRVVHRSGGTSEPFDKARRTIGYIETDYQEEIMKLRKQLKMKQEEAEILYRKELKKLEQK